MAQNNMPTVNPKVVANVFRVYENSLVKHDDFMLGWRAWSFHMTQKGAPSSYVECDNIELIETMKSKGASLRHASVAEWKNIRRWLMTGIINVNPRMGDIHTRYRYLFKHVAFVLIDCCFAVKYQLNSYGLRQLLIKMFRKTGTKEVPSYFIILDNGIGRSEFNHKLNQNDREQYRDTQSGIIAYQRYQPTIQHDGIAKLDIPIAMAHDAMMRSEDNVRNLAKRQVAPLNTLPSRACINDHAQIYLMDRMRRAFGRCARVALLSDDYTFTKTTSEFKAPSTAVNVNADLPSDYTAPYFVTPFLIQREEWTKWRKQNAYPAFAKQFEEN